MLYDAFVKNCVTFKNTQLSNPKIVAKGKLFLPLHSVYHTNEEGFGEFSVEDDIINNFVGKYKGTVEHVLGVHDNVTLLGLVQKRTYSRDAVVKEFERNNKRFEKFTSAQSGIKTNGKLLHVVNHGNAFYEITQKEESRKEYHEFLNYWNNFFANLIDFLAKDKRYHFFKLEVPTITPPKTILEQLEPKEDLSVTDLGKLVDNNQLLVLDLWRWFNLLEPEIRKLSFFSKIKEEDLSRVHLIYDLGKGYAIFNLGLLISWIKTDKNEKGFWKTPEFRKKFLATLVRLADIRANDTPIDDYDAELDKADEFLDNLDEDENLDNTNDGHSALLEVEEEIDKVETLANKKEERRKGFYRKDVKAEDANSLLKSDFISLLSNDTEEFIADNLDDEIEMSIAIKEDKMLEELETIHQAAIDNKTLSEVGEYTAYKPELKSLDEYVTDKVNDVASKGLMSTAERNRFKRLANSWETIKAPNGQDMKDYLQINEEDKRITTDTKIADEMAGVLDKSFYNSSLKKMDKVYAEKFLDRHVHAMIINSIQREGIIVKDIKRKHEKTLIDDYYHYSVKIIPVVGEESTISFKIPRVNSDGTMIARGVKVRMRKQRADLPIRKLSYNKVSMTSYHSKMFVTRSERVTNSYDKWIEKQIYLGTLTEEVHVKELVYGDCFDKSYHCPRIFSTIARSYTSFSLGSKGEYHLNFDWKTHKDTKVNKSLVKDDEVICGDFNGTPIVIDSLGILTLIKDNKRELVGNLEDMIGVAPGVNRPIPMIDVGPIAGKDIPLGVLLAYYLGLGNFLTTLGVEYRRVNKGSRLNLEANEFVIAFSDQSLIVKNLDPITTALVNGFNRYKTITAGISIWDFDKRDGFIKLFDANGIRTRQMHRLDQIRKNWIDPITEDILVEMNYPTDMVLLFIEAARLLELDNHPDETDINYSRVRGYERISGMVYTELMDSLTNYNMMPGKTAKVTMNPETIWYDVTTDQTTAPVEDSNPIHSIKDKSVVVFSGAGGRAGNTITASARQYDKSGIGVVSLDTVDSGDVATIVYLSANPNINSIYGTSTTLENTNGKNSVLYSDSDLLVPGHVYDDPKRRNFSHIQNSATTHCNGYTIMPCRTGFEKTIAQRSGELFAATASGKGVVEYVGKKVIRINYEDGETVSYQIGRRYGNWSGKVIPHKLVTKLRVGDKVKENDIIYYNELFFQDDIFSTNGGDLSLKWAVLGRVAFLEVKETLEDGNGASAQFVEKLETTDCKTKYISVPFEYEVKNLLPVGTNVNDDSILCTIMPPTSESLIKFEQEAAETLQRLSVDSPKAKFNGEIEQYRIYYAGDISEMSPSLALLVEKSNDEILSLSKAMKDPAMDGSVPVGTRINGKVIPQNTVIIEVRMVGGLKMKSGDKLVVGAQMKSIIGKIYDEAPITEDGKPVDVSFSNGGIFNRMVQSCFLMGAINTTMLKADDKMLDIYFGAKE